MSRITTHVLDTVTGTPAAEIRVHLDKRQGATWTPVSTSATDSAGHCHLTQDAPAATYRLTFDIGSYLAAAGRNSVFPEIVITFTCTGDAHYHLPILLSNHSYTTYKAS